MMWMHLQRTTPTHCHQIIKPIVCMAPRRCPIMLRHRAKKVWALWATTAMNGLTFPMAKSTKVTNLLCKFSQICSQILYDTEICKRKEVIVFYVLFRICERKKNHRSPDWNRKVREQRMHQHHEDNLNGKHLVLFSAFVMILVIARRFY